ncbi:MAG TPA: ATP-binding protein [Thermoanaerobaculia bacterium]|nr:ATP-binding protein [Thermoanaerobaculia bacterium]
MSLRSLFTILFALLALAAAVSLGLVMDATLRQAVEDRVSARILHEMDHVAEDLKTVAPEDLDTYLRRTARSLACRITRISPDGHVENDTDIAPAEVPSMENHGNRPDVLEARKDGHGFFRDLPATEIDSRFYFARRLDGGDVLRFSVPAEGVRELESGYLWTARAAIALACLLLFTIGTWASRRFSEPIAKLTEAASAIAAGEPRDLPQQGGREVQLLSGALQRMKDSLARAAERSEAERRLTAVVFEKLPDGLVILDSKLHVLEANERFSRMVGLSAPAGKALYDVLRLRSLYEVFEEALARGETGEETVRLSDGLVWQVLVVPLPPGSRAAAVGVLRDVTRLERTEAMRRTFVADVSHELRTPIASIAAAAETLAEAGPDEAEHGELVALIQRQSAHMKELIDDLMDLAQIESGSVELQGELVPLAPLLRETARDLAAQASLRRVEVQVCGDENAAAFADRRRLRQVARNLLDNAVKFSPEGSPVTLTAFREPGWTGFSVADRGPGIPRAEREKIFQRFYQVDRSRSKTRAGTGLGLAIVKHLVHLNDGTVEVESEVGQGSRFTVRLPAP